LVMLVLFSLQGGARYEAVDPEPSRGPKDRRVPGGRQEPPLDKRIPQHWERALRDSKKACPCAGLPGPPWIAGVPRGPLSRSRGWKSSGALRCRAVPCTPSGVDRGAAKTTLGSSLRPRGVRA